MKRHDQGHLHPKLEIPRLTCLGRDRTRAWEAGTPTQSYSNSVVAIRNINLSSRLCLSFLKLFIKLFY
jgi:hypothetical protein